MDTVKDLKGKDLRGADLRRKDLRGADLTDCDMRGCNMTVCSLTGADLRGCNLSGCNLTGCDLSGADLRGCNMRDCKLTYCKLTGCNLRGANLENITGYADSHEVFFELVRRQGVSAFSNAEWAMIGQVAVLRLCWETIESRFGKVALHILQVLADAGFDEYLRKYEDWLPLLRLGRR